MKAHRAEIEVTTKWVIEVHGEDDEAVTKTVENMDNTQIEAAGDFVELVKIEVTDIEVMYPEDYDDEEVVEPDQELVDLDSLKAPDGEEEEEPNAN